MSKLRYPDGPGIVRHETPFTPSRRIQQEDEQGCFVACLAMARAETYKQVTDLIGEDLMFHIRKEGLVGKMVEIVLKKLGWVEYYHYRWIPGFTGRMGFYVIPWAFDRPAIFQVDSINFEGKQHMVYWDGRSLFDPSPLKTYTLADIGTKGVHNALLISPWIRGES